MHRLPRLLCLFAFTLPSLAIGADSCAATVVPNPRFVPPTQAALNPGEFWYGTNDLWTTLPSDGIWHLSSKTYQGLNRVSLWKPGYDGLVESHPDISIDLKRLDADSAPAHSKLGTNANVNGIWRMATGITFPSAGCWQVTLSNDGHVLTFVASVQH